MTLSTAMRFVMMRAEREAAQLGHKEISPEHILLGILKIAECTAEGISPTSRHKAQTDRDIAVLRERFRAMQVDTAAARANLRRIMRFEPPIGGDAAGKQLLDAAGMRSREDDTLYPSDVLFEMMNNPTPQIKAVLNIKGTSPLKENPQPQAKAALKPNESFNAGEIPKNAGNGKALHELSALTRRLRDMRCALLKKIHGQDHAVHAFTEGMFASEALAAEEGRKRPRAVFVFAGPPGVGKTYLSEQAAEALDIPCRCFDMSGFSDHQAGNMLIGFSNAYKNAVEGQLTGFVKKNPRCILIFDEIEKAHLNVIHLFLQILDAGRLHDDFHDADVIFKDTVIIFTTNAGRQLYEGDRQFNAAGLSRRTILNALKTDTAPSSSKPFFPPAICSRLGTGFLLMFNHIAAHNLESIAMDELTRLCGAFSKQYGIKTGFDALLTTVLLFAEGGLADARTLRAQCGLFFKNEVFKLCRLWGEHVEDALTKLQSLRFTVETGELPEDVGKLFESTEKQELLVFGDETFAARLEQTAPDFVVRSALSQDEAFSLLSKEEISFVLLKPVKRTGVQGTVVGFENTPPGANSLYASRSFFKALRERMPEMPVYLLETGDFVIDEELENAFVSVGARGKLIAPHGSMDVFAEELGCIARQLHLQNSAASMAAARKTLSFDTAPIMSADKKEVTVRLRSFAERRAADADDVSTVLDAVEKPAVRFTDVIGAQSAKEELEFFIQYLRNPKSFAAKGLRAPKGVLLYGPPGTGKTLLARALAGESDAAFISCAASSFVTKWQGSGPESVRELFSRARRYAPSIVFIDELDAIGRARGVGGSGHAEEMALNALLTEMDGFKADLKKPVFVLAATNFDVEEGKGGLGLIDPALARRFDRRILVDLPAKEDRERYLEYALGNRNGHTVGRTMITRLAERSAGFALANLESVIELAARNAARRNEPLSEEILEDAFEEFRHGERKDWGREYLERVARHESGHALLCWLSGETPNYLTIVSRSDHGGYMEHTNTESQPLQTREALLARIRTALGGRAAELVYYGDEGGLSTGAAGDLESATRVAAAMLTRYGMDAGFGLAVISGNETEKGLAAEINSKINAILNGQMDKAISLIRDGREKIDRLADALLEKNKLAQPEIETLLSDPKIL